MQRSLMEKVRIDCAGINSTSSSLYTPSFSMKGYHRAAVVVSVGAITATGETIHVSLLGGDSTTAPASMSSLTNATLDIGTSSTKGTVNNANKVRISVLGSAIASALSIVVGTSTFISDSTASSTGKAFLSGAASVVCESLTTMIQTYYPNVNATYSGTGSTACYVDVDLWNHTDSSGLVFQTTAQATAGGLGVASQMTQGMIIMDAGDLTSTASSFTNFCALVNCTGSSAVPFAVTVIREGVSARDVTAGWGPKTDMSTATLV